LPEQTSPQVLEIMLHPDHKKSLGASGLERLAKAGRAAALRSQSLLFAVTGVLETNPDEEQPATRKVRTSMVNNVRQVARSAWNMLVPCFPLHEQSARHVMSKHRLDEAGSASASTTCAYLLCEKLYQCKPTPLCILLRKLPPSQARSMRVLLQQVLKKAQDNASGGFKHACVVLDGLGITDADVPDYIQFFKLCSWLVLRDNPLGPRGLEDMHQRLMGRGYVYRISKVIMSCLFLSKHNRVFPFSTDSDSEIGREAVKSRGGASMRKLDLLMSAPMPAKMVLALAGMALEVQIKCSIKGAVFCSHQPDNAPRIAANYAPTLDEVFVLLQQQRPHDELFKLLKDKAGDLKSEDWQALSFTLPFSTKTFTTLDLR